MVGFKTELTEEYPGHRIVVVLTGMGDLDIEGVTHRSVHLLETGDLDEIRTGADNKHQAMISK
jgi:hypothetical protein